MVIFSPEGCGKSAFLRQVSAMLRELGFYVFYLHPLEREFRAEVAVPDIRREFVQFVERALGENALSRVAWAVLDFVRKLQKARRGKNRRGGRRCLPGHRAGRGGGVCQGVAEPYRIPSVEVREDGRPRRHQRGAFAAGSWASSLGGGCPHVEHV